MILRSLLLLTLRVAAIPSAATICSTACASPASLRHADVPEALIAAGEPRHADAQLAWPWPRRPLRGLNGSASLAGPGPCPSHLRGRAVGPEGCVRERQPACVGRQPCPLPSPPCARVLASLLLCTCARHALPVYACTIRAPRRPRHTQGSTTSRARAALSCWSRGASTCRKSLSRPWRTRAPALAFSACSCLAPTASVRLRNGPSARRMI